MNKKVKVKVGVNVETLFIGEEPVWGDSKKEIPLSRALSWYSNQYSPKESKKYTLDYLKHFKYPKDTIEKVSSSPEYIFKNLGFVCRIIQRGAPIDKEDWIKERIEKIINHKVEDEVVSEFAAPKAEKTIQDRVYDQCSQFISDIEDRVDEFIKTKKAIDFNPYEWMNSRSVKPVHAKQIQEHFKPTLEELKSVIDKTDEELVEGYFGYKKTELNAFYKLVESIIDDCSKLIDNTKAIKAPRKKKAIPLEKKVVGVKYKKEDNEFKIASVSPTEIIGATQLWVFNTKYKKLGIYRSKDDSGFSIKGTTIEGFDENLSIQKTLRKPLEVLDNFKKAKKPELKKFMATINCKESTLNGRINTDTILLKVLK